MVYYVAMFSKDFTFSKRQLGILMVVAGVIGIVVVLSFDLVGVGRDGDIGPAQRIGLGITGCLMFVGLTFIPLGDDPA